MQRLAITFRLCARYADRLVRLLVLKALCVEDLKSSLLSKHEMKRLAINFLLCARYARPHPRHKGALCRGSQVPSSQQTRDEASSHQLLPVLN